MRGTDLRDYISSRLDLFLAGVGLMDRFGPHALSPFPVVARRIEPPDGCGTIRFTSRMIVRAAEPREREPEPGAPLPPIGQEHRLIRPTGQVPVVLVDGIPAATGLGSGRIVVPAGRHLVQVQSLGSGRYWPVEVEAGKEVRLKSVVAEPYFSSRLAERMRRFYGCFSLGPRAFLRRRQTLIGPTVLAVAVYCFMFRFVSGPEGAAGPIAAVVAGLLSALAPWPQWAWFKLRGTPVARYEAGGDEITWRPVDPDDDTPPVPGEAAVLRIHPVFLHDEVRDRRPIRVPRSRPPEIPMGARPLAHPAEDPDAPLIAKLGLELECTGRWAKDEWGTLVRDMRWDREARALAETRRQETLKGAVVPWIDPPRITIGGREIPAIWGLNEYRLPPGEHLVEIAIPGPPPALDRRGERDLQRRSRLLYELDLRGGTTTEIEAYAHLKSRMDPQGTGMRDYEGRIWASLNPRNPR